jgi:hypothetical protein
MEKVGELELYIVGFVDRTAILLMRCNREGGGSFVDATTMTFLDMLPMLPLSESSGFKKLVSKNINF